MFVPILVFVAALGLTTAAVAQAQSVTGTDTASAATQRYVVTLASSFDPLPDSLMPTDLNGLRVYRTQNIVFGKTIYFIRAGFFATMAEAEAAKTRLSARFPGAFVTEITPEELASVAGPREPKPEPTAKPVAPVTATTTPTPVIPLAAPAAAPVPAPVPGASTATAAKPAVVAAEKLFAITLLRSSNGKAEPLAPLPKELATNRLYRQESRQAGKTVTTLNLGFFGTAADAEAARRQLQKTYPDATVRTASAAERDESARSAVAFTPPLPTPATTSAPAAAPKPVESKFDQTAANLMEQARGALTRGDNVAAIQLLDQVLRLPPNKYSQDAQELVGLAQERSGALTAAKKEYSLYLKLYPEGEGAERVRQRLANLEALGPSEKLRAARKQAVNVTTVYGGLSQYYYRGDLKVDTATNTGPTIDKATLSSTDQSSLITSLDLTGRMRSGDWDNRVVVRDSYTSNFLPNSVDQNRLYSAYAEVRNKTDDYGGRLGRQPGNTGGALGSFDGVSLGYGVLPKWRLNVIAGKPVEFTPINSQKQFWGTNIDVGTFAEHWNGNIYYINQTVDGITDREAVGTEIRYFDPKGSMLLLTDYDISYSELNIAMLQGTWQPTPQTTYNLVADRRHTPTLTTSNAVIGEIDTSISNQLLTHTEAQLRQQALDRTQTAVMYMAGVTHSLNPVWQLGGNVQLYNVSGMPGSGTMPPTPGTGNTLVYTLQTIANGLFTNKHDISVLNLSYLTSNAFDGTSISFNNRAIYRDRWTVDWTLAYYQQSGTLGASLNRLTPQFRIGYRWRDNLLFEVEMGLEKTHSDALTPTGTQSEDTMRYFYSAGYRWDF